MHAVLSQSFNSDLINFLSNFCPLSWQSLCSFFVNMHPILYYSYSTQLYELWERTLHEKFDTFHEPVIDSS